MKPRLRRLGGELFWVAFGQGLVAAGGLLGVRLLTEVLPPAVFGELALAMTVVAFVQVSLQQPLFEGSRRFFQAAGQKGETRPFLRAVRRLAWRVSLILTVATLVVAASLVVAHQTEWIGLVWAAFAVCFISTWSITITGILSASRQRAVIAGQEGLQQWLRFGIAAALVWWTGPHSGVAMAGYGVAAGLVLAGQVWLLRGTLPTTADSHGHNDGTVRAWEERVLAYAWPFVAWGAALSVQTASARWSLQLFEAPEAVGLFAVLYHVGHYPVMLLVGVLSKFVSPVIFNRAGAGEDAARTGAARRLGKLLVASAVGLTLIATAVAVFAHDLVFAALVAPEYRGVSWLLPVQVLGSGLLVASQSASVLPLVAANSHALLKPKIVSAALGTALNVLAAWQYGLPGVVCAGVAYGAISYVWIAGVGGLHRADRVPPHTRDPCGS